jgi:hypothetical protein
LLGQQTRARRKRPLSFTRTFPLARRSATAATISVLLRVQELTARIRSPSESRARGLMIWRNWRFLFIRWPFLPEAGAMPDVIVNMSSMGMRSVIHFLYTLELTVQRHICSILKHEYAANVSTSDGCRSLIVDLRPLAQAAIPFAAYVSRDFNRFAFYLSK